MTFFALAWLLGTSLCVFAEKKMYKHFNMDSTFYPGDYFFAISLWWIILPFQIYFYPSEVFFSKKK